MAKVSFSDVIETESGRIVDSLFQNFPNINSFEEFDSKFREFFSTPLGENAQISSDDIIKLFNSSEAKDRIKDNTTAKEFKDVYGDGDIIQRVSVTDKKVATVVFKKIPIPSHTRSGRPVSAYSKGWTKWTNAETNFLKQRKELPRKQAVQEYNKHFDKNPRTPSSISTKFRRI